MNDEATKKIVDVEIDDDESSADTVVKETVDVEEDGETDDDDSSNDTEDETK